MPNMILKFQLYRPAYIDRMPRNAREISTFQEIYELPEVKAFKGPEFEYFYWELDRNPDVSRLTLSSMLGDGTHWVVGFLYRYDENGNQVDI